MTFFPQDVESDPPSPSLLLRRICNKDTHSEGWLTEVMLWMGSEVQPLIWVWGDTEVIPLSVSIVWCCFSAVMQTQLPSPTAAVDNISKKVNARFCTAINPLLSSLTRKSDSEWVYDTLEWLSYIKVCLIVFTCVCLLIQRQDVKILHQHFPSCLLMSGFSRTLWENKSDQWEQTTGASCSMQQLPWGLWAPMRPVCLSNG